jgi:hypothetical protein
MPDPIFDQDTDQIHLAVQVFNSVIAMLADAKLVNKLANSVP